MSVVDQQTAVDIRNLLEDNKRDVKKGALMVLMQALQVKENLQVFKDKQIIKILLREFTEGEMEKGCLSTMIMLSGDSDYRQQVVEVKGVLRLVERLQDLVRIVIKNDPKFQENKEFQKLVTDQIQMVLLLLSNLLMDLEGSRQLLQMDAVEVQGVQLIHLLNYYQSNNPVLRTCFLYFANILTNLTAFPDIRQHLVTTQIAIIPRLTLSLLSENNSHRRMQDLKSLRNLTFEYESAFILESILSPEVNYVQTMELYLLKLAYTFQFLKVDECYYELIGHQKFSNNSKYFEEIVLIVDILTTLTNVDMVETKVNFHLQLIIQIMTGLKKLKEIMGYTKDKIDVILAIFCKINEFQIA